MTIKNRAQIEGIFNCKRFRDKNEVKWVIKSFPYVKIRNNNKSMILLNDYLFEQFGGETQRIFNKQTRKLVRQEMVEKNAFDRRLNNPI